MHRHLATGICLLFLAYGLVRLAVGALVLGQVVGIIDIPDLREPVAEVGAFLAALGDQPLVSAGPAGYMVWLVLMGGVLTVGATLALLRRRGGAVLIGTFLVLWAALFVNFQTVNPKLVHLAVAAGLFGVLLWLQRNSGSAGAASPADGMVAASTPTAPPGASPLSPDLEHRHADPARLRLLELLQHPQARPAVEGRRLRRGPRLPECRRL